MARWEPQFSPAKQCPKHAHTSETALRCEHHPQLTVSSPSQWSARPSHSALCQHQAPGRTPALGRHPPQCCCTARLYNAHSLLHGYLEAAVLLDAY